jgi:branched-chain amino acid transport system substrate-binding protein
VATRAAAASAAADIVGSGVDGVFFSGRAAVGRALVVDLSGNGYQGAILMASDSPASILRELGSTADGVYVASAADDPAATAARNPGALAFYDAYRGAFGSQPPIWAAEGYDATDAVLAALTGGARTGPTIGSYLLAHSSGGVSGPVAFGPDGNQVDPPVYVSEIRDGQPVQVAITGGVTG